MRFPIQMLLCMKQSITIQLHERSVDVLREARRVT